MNIVLCLNHFMPQQVAGTEVYTWALAKALIKKGHRVTIVVPNYDTDVNDEYVYEDLCIKRYAEPNHIDTRLRSGQRPPDGIESFKQLIAAIGPDVVHVQELAGSSGIGIFHLRVLKMMNVKIIFTMHLANYSCFCGTLMYRGKEHCDGMIDISRCTKCALSKLQIGELSQQLLYNASMPLYTLGINTGKMNNAAGTAFSYPFVIKKFTKKTV